MFLDIGSYVTSKPPQDHCSVLTALSPKALDDLRCIPFMKG